MKRSLSLVPILLLGAGFANASVISTYNSQSSFDAALYPGYYAEPFNTSTSGNSLNYSGNGYAYTVSDSSGLIPPTLQTWYQWLQETNAGDTITITFTSGNVTAIGGDFFAVNLGASPTGSTDTLTFSDGTKKTFTTTTSTSTFTGYTFNTPITSLTFTTTSSFLAPRWAAMDNFTVGTAAPEPGTWTLLGAGMGLLAFVKLRRR